MQNKKGSILLISSWVLLILVVLAIGLGHRSSIALRLCAYQKDSLKASYLAKAGINQAIVRLKEDTSPYNSLKSVWSTGVDPITNEPFFKNVQIRDSSGEKFTVRYLYDDENYLCIMDEERKININKAVTDPVLQFMLTRLFDFAGVENPDDLKNLVVKWIGVAYDNSEDPGRIFKNSELKTTEELLPILEFFYQDESNPSLRARQVYGKIKDLITVYGDGKININTVDKTTLDLLIQSCKDQVEKDNPGSPMPTDLGELSAKIKEYLDHNNGYFTSITLVNRSVLGLSDSFDNIITKLQSVSNVKSNNFRINSTGEIIGKSVSKTITCVFNRDPSVNKIIYWHEN